VASARPTQRRLPAALVLLAGGIIAAACGGGGGDDAMLPFATATRGDAGPTATSSGGEPEHTPDGDTEPAPAPAGETTLDHIVLHDEHWVETQDQLGRPGVRYAAIVENTGPLPVEVEISFEAFDDAGTEIGEPFQEFRQALGPGTRLPVVLSAGLDASPATVEPDISIRQIPDFRRERYGHVLLEGRIVEVSHEVRSTDVMLTFTMEATNTGTGTAAFGVTPHIAIYDGTGALTGGGFIAGAFAGLCPGESATAQMTFRVFVVDFEPETASYEVFFPDVEVPEPGTC
jgi:hypothetical protein